MFHAEPEFGRFEIEIVTVYILILFVLGTFYFLKNWNIFRFADLVQCVVETRWFSRGILGISNGSEEKYIRRVGGIKVLAECYQKQRPTDSEILEAEVDGC